MARGEASTFEQGPYEYFLLEDMAATPPYESEKEKKVVDDTNSDDEVLAQLGYTQGMKRFSGWHV